MLKDKFRITQRKTSYRIEERIGEDVWRPVDATIYYNLAYAMEQMERHSKEMENNGGWVPVNVVSVKV